jgi:hypothetical protein
MLGSDSRVIGGISRAEAHWRPSENYFQKKICFGIYPPP